MKKTIALLMMLILLCVSSVMAESQIAEDWLIDDQAEDVWTSDNPLLGGWEICDLATAKGSDSVRAVFEKATKDLTDVKYTGVALLATQAVSGLNYCFLCQCAYQGDDSQETGWSLVYVYQSLDGEAKVTNVVNIDIAELSDYGLLH